MIIDKLDNLEEVFDEINTLFDLGVIKLNTEVPDYEGDRGSIFMQSFWDVRTQTAAHLLNIKDGQIVYGDYYQTLYHRLFQFIEHIDIEVNPLSRTIMLILHELGHINRMNMMAMFNQERIMNLVDDVTESILDDRTFTQYAYQIITTDNLDLRYILKANVMYADTFAMKWFMLVWKCINS